MKRRLRALLLVAAGCCAAGTARADGGEKELQPYQLVRSLQALQDRIADGDHAALPLQRKMLEVVDSRLGATADAAYKQQRNVRAALIYGMSGGNPATLAGVLRRSVVSREDKTIGQGVLAYMNGKNDAARAALADIDALKYPAEIGAFIALMKGSVTSGTDAKIALRQFDLARLLGPGTLVEEAALRRSLVLEAFLKETDRFLMASEQYARRFLRSPYAGQFADSFVSGILDLHEGLDLERVDRITRLMNAERRKVIYLRLARRATIDGLTELSAFASREAEETSPGSDARAALYARLSDLTAEDVGQIASSLRTIDRQQLSESDLRLLEAAQTVVSEITAPARPSPGETSPEQPSPSTDKPAEAAGNALPEPAPAQAEEPEAARAGEAAAGGDHPAPDIVEGAQISDAASGKVDDVTDMVKATRARLSAIDQLLETSK